MLEQSGPSFTVVLSGRRFADDPAAGLQNRFTGVVFGDQVVLDIRDPLVEVVTDQNYLFFDGLGVGTIGRQTIRGVLAGTVLWGGYPSESCSHEGHEFTLTRVTSSGRVR